MNTILIYVLICLLGLNAITTIGMIDQPRKPITHGGAIVSVIVDVVFIILLLFTLN